MALQRPACPGAVLLALFVSSACCPGAAVRLAPGRKEMREAEALSVPPVLAAMPGFQADPATGGARHLPPALTRLSRQSLQHQRDEVVLHALRDPWWVGNRHLHLVTVETRPNRTKIRGIKNIGLQHKWRGFVTKLEIVTNWLDDCKDDCKNGKDHIIVVDGDDTLFGGCSQEQFLHDYREIVNSSGGAEVVIGAERGCYDLPKPWTCQDMPEVPQWAYRDWKLASGGKRMKCSPLDASGQMRFLNSGFLTGPADQLREIFRWSLDKMVAGMRQRVTDQHFVAEYFLSKPGRAALDYASSLVTSGYSLNVTALFKLLPGGGLYNRVTHKHQCFFHANGASVSAAQGIISWQQRGGMP
mmetsp:Transcript_98715/g.287952  ORF Transcript_98715/g.287952 Transcript_98715/m.287952 type:complete len:357 (+) Transcript_98715:90-1160(+)